MSDEAVLNIDLHFGNEAASPLPYELVSPIRHVGLIYFLFINLFVFIRYHKGNYSQNF